MTEPPPPPRSPDCPPHEVTHAKVNIAQATHPSPTCANKASVAHLVGGSLGVTQNKRPSIQREKLGHTPARKKHGDGTQRASSVRAQAAIQDALSSKMRTLHVDDSISQRINMPDHCPMMFVTPNNNDDDDQRVDDLADDKDYNPMPVANPLPKSRPKRWLEIKTANQS
jgi:hypothetical protein